MPITPRPVIAHPSDNYAPKGGVFLGHAGSNWDYYRHGDRVVTIPVREGCRASGHGSIAYWAASIFRQGYEHTLSNAGRAAYRTVYPKRAEELWGPPWPAGETLNENLRKLGLRTRPTLASLRINNGGKDILDEDGIVLTSGTADQVWRWLHASGRIPPE